MNFYKYNFALFCISLFFFNITNTFAQTGCYQLDWETDCSGNPFPEGLYVPSNAYSCIGVTITNYSTLPLVLFNSSNPTGGDSDLGSPSSNCPTCTGSCPGVSSNANGGLTNCVNQGLVMVTEENPADANNDGLEDVPDDFAASDYEFCFSSPVTISTLSFLDDSQGTITFTYATTPTTTSAVSLTGGLDNDAYTQLFNESNVTCMRIVLTTSGAITLANFCYDDDEQAPCDLVAPVLGADVDICEGDDPGPIEVVTAASGTGTITYQWQQSLVGCEGFGDISGATSSTYNPGVLVQSTYFKVLVTTTSENQICVEESNCITYTEEVCTECAEPEITALAAQPTCDSGVAQSDGYLEISSISVGDAYHWSLGSTFNDNSGANTYTNATNISTATFPIQLATGQPNPTSSQDYTIRIYNGENGCFTDITVTMSEVVCPVCTNPVVTASAVQPTCVSGVAQSDGYLEISSISVGDAYHWSLGSTFNDNSGANTYTNATNISTATFPIQLATGQPNPTSSQDYTIRVYNGENGCFMDVVVMMNAVDCDLCDEVTCYPIQMTINKGE